MKSKKFIRSNPQLPVRNLRETLDYYRDTLDSMMNGSAPTITVKKPMAASGVMTCVYFLPKIHISQMLERSNQFLDDLKKIALLDMLKKHF
jgi:hypothetical protein